jgi:hypothetical protein
VLQPPPAAPLDSTRQVAWTSYLRGPRAGIILLGLTLGRLGRERERCIAFAWGGLARLATALAAIVAPTDLPNAVIPALGVIAMEGLAERLLGREFRRHAPAGRATASFGRALGASLVAWPTSLLFLYAVTKSVDLTPISCITPGANEVCYEGLATRADAERLVGLLRERGVIGDESAWMLTLREVGDDSATIGITVPAEAAENDAFIGELDALRKQVRAELHPDGAVHFELRNFLGATIRRIPRTP